MNLATKAPNFTRETARAAALKSAEVRRQNREREKLALAAAVPDSDDARKQRTLKQLDKLDALIDAALVRGDEDSFLRLTAAKDKLWKLVQPTAGQLRPGRKSPRSSAPLAEPLP
jgi:hypothetical protein